MPVRSSLLFIVGRLTVYAVALLIVATARVPQTRVDTSVSAVRPAPSDASGANVAWRLVIAGLLLTGVALEIRRRGPVWH